MAITTDVLNLGSFSAWTTASATVAFTTTSTVTANAFIVVGVCWTGVNANTTLLSVSGGALVWTIDKQGLDTAGGFGGAAIVSAQAPAGLASGTAITGTYSDVCDKRLVTGSSLTGVKTSSPVDGTPPATVYTSVQTTWATNAYTTTRPGSVVTALAWNPFNQSTNTPTVPGLNLWQVYDTPNTLGCVGEYRVDPTAGSYSLAGTWGTTTQTLVVAVGYLSAASPGTVRQATHGIGMGRW